MIVTNQQVNTCSRRFFLPADLKVEAALKRMQRSGQWLAIVTSESQKEAGIVSLQDILKVVFSDPPKK